MAEQVHGISVIIPVGPQPEYRKYLADCLNSVDIQVNREDEIILVDDMAHLSREDMQEPTPGEWTNNCPRRIVRNDWLLGCADSWNRGVALAKNEWCILMGSDDKLLPGCLDICRAMIKREDCDPFGYYGLSCEWSNGDITDWLNNAALVSRSLWKLTGGFPPTASVGAPDALLVSIMIRNLPQHLHQLNKGEPLYWVRTHEAQETGRTGKFWPEIISIRDKETADWKEPIWTSQL